MTNESHDAIEVIELSEEIEINVSDLEVQDSTAQKPPSVSLFSEEHAHVESAASEFLESQWAQESPDIEIPRHEGESALQWLVRDRIDKALRKQVFDAFATFEKAANKPKKAKRQDHE